MEKDIFTNVKETTGSRLYCLQPGDVFALGGAAVKLLLQDIKYVRHEKFNIFKPKTWFRKRFFVLMVIT